MYKIFIDQLELKVAIFQYLNFAIFVLIFHNKFLFSFFKLVEKEQNVWKYAVFVNKN